jgi:hypothetical protein
VGFEPTNSAGERPQTNALDRAVTGADTLILKIFKNIFKNLPLHVSVRIYDHLQGVYEQCFIPLTAQTAVYKPPEDGRIYGPKHVGASFFKIFLSVLSINVN